jgi:DNA-binding NtrC family response regulator
MARILTIDDDEDVLFQLRFVLSRAGHEVFPLLRADRIAEQVKKVAPDIVISDLVMPGIMGGGVYHLLRKEVGPQLPIIISSGTKLKIRGSENDPLLAYCPKPVDFDQMLVTIDELLQKKQQAAEELDDTDDVSVEH